MRGYTKLVPEITQSSIWNENSDIRIVWITMLAIKDENGYVRGNAQALSRIANVPVEAVETALEKFQQPDPESHTPDNDGRRIEAAPGGWTVLNHEHYREIGMSEATKQYWREQKRKVREKYPSRPKSNDGYVYYAGVPDGERVKIGHSKNPWSRVNEMRVAVPDLELFAVESGPAKLEKERHEQFKQFNIDREWFKASAEIQSFIRSVQDRSTTVRDTTDTTDDEEGDNPKKPKMDFDYDTEKFTNVNQEYLDKWKDTFPAVDIVQEMKQAALWLATNPKKRKKDVRRFLTNWFSKSQERGGGLPSNPVSRGAGRPAARRSTPDPDDAPDPAREAKLKKWRERSKAFREKYGKDLETEMMNKRCPQDWSLENDNYKQGEG